MSMMILARRYANALGQTLDSREDFRTALYELESFADAFKSNAELRAALTNPSIPINARTAIVDEVLDSEKSPSQTKRLIRTLFDRRRLGLITEVAKAFRETRDGYLNRLVGTITSSREISEEQRDSIQRNAARYMGRDVKLETQIDPDILGGIVVRIGSTVIDGSLRARLAQLKKTLLAEENGQYENSGH